jgi:trans-aconitate methyltransferase
MSFEVAAEAYAAYMGRYSEPLADSLLRLVDPAPGMRAADIGCGPGAVTVRLARLLGAERVMAVDPSESFVAAARDRCPGADIRIGTAESLPWGDDTVDVAIAQLVVAFMEDPVAGMHEMARVTKPGGTVAAAMWDLAGGRAPLSPMWQAAADMWPGHDDESGRPGVSEGDLESLMVKAGLQDVKSTEITVRAEYATFEEWWTPYTFRVGPAGDFIAGLSDGARNALAQRCRELLPPSPFGIDATAWVATGTPAA